MDDLKKKMMFGCGLLAALLLIWAGAKSLDAEAEARTKERVSENDPANSPEDGEGKDQEDPSGDSSLSESGENKAEDSGEAAEDVSGNNTAEESAHALDDMLEEEGTLYVLKTADGSNLGMVPVVAGNAVVLLDDMGADIYQGDYVPEESAFQSALEEITSRTAAEGKIPEWAFYRQSLLRSYDWQGEISSIGRFAFARTNLESIVIPEGVTTIGYGAFYHCDALTDVVIPDSVTTIEENAFVHTPWLDNWMAGGSAVGTKAEENGAEAAGQPEMSGIAGTEENSAEAAGQTEASEQPEIMGTEGISDGGDFLIVGDGILLAYRGEEKDPELPENVKCIAAGAFGNN